LAGGLEKKYSEFSGGHAKLLGDELQFIQFGGMPKDAKPFKGVGSGVLEIALRYASDAYRVVLAVQVAHESMSCMLFRRNPRKALQRQYGTFS
jgi:phage-related protein